MATRATRKLGTLGTAVTAAAAGIGAYNYSKSGLTPAAWAANKTKTVGPYLSGISRAIRGLPPNSGSNNQPIVPIVLPSMNTTSLAEVDGLLTSALIALKRARSDREKSSITMKNTFSNNPTKTMNFDNVQTAANWFNAFFKLGRRPPKSLGEAEAIFMAVDDKLNKSTQPGTAARIGSFFGMGEKQLKGGSRSRSRKNRRRSYRK